MLYIGVDLGTSAVKLLLMDEKGEIKNVISREYPLFSRSPAGLNRTRRTGKKQCWKAFRNCSRARTLPR